MGARHQADPVVIMILMSIHSVKAPERAVWPSWQVLKVLEGRWPFEAVEEFDKEIGAGCVATSLEEKGLT